MMDRTLIKKTLCPWITVFMSVFLLGACGLIIVGYHLEKWRAPTRNTWSAVRVGDDQIAVRSLLGEPDREYSKEAAPHDYYVSGYAVPDRSITGCVLI